MSLIKYTFLYRNSSSNVIISTTDGLFSTTVSSSTQLIVIDGKLNIPISQTSFINMHYLEVASINGQSIEALGITNLSTLVEYLTTFCFKNSQSSGGSGTNGANGTNGVDGKSLRFGTIVPSNSLYSDGDTYMNNSDFSIYQKSSGSWSFIGNLKGTDGYTLPSLTSGSVLFSDGTTIVQNNSNLFWDNVNNRLGIGLSTPSSTLDIIGTTKISSLVGSGTRMVVADLNGLLSTQTIPSGGGGGGTADNLGNHTATQNLDLSSYKLVGNGGIVGISISSSGVVNLPSTTNVGTITSTEINYLSGATSNIQSQIGLKQNILTGSGFVKSTSGTISYDTNTYLTAVPAQTFTSLTGKPTTLSGYGITDAYPLTGNPSNFLISITSQNVVTALGYTPYNATNPSGYITSSSLSSYLLSSTASTTYQPIGSYLTSISSANVTTALGFTPYNATNPSGYITSSNLSSYLPILGGTLTGTAGSGFHGFIAQSSNPSTPSSGFNLYANSNNAFSWKGVNGYVRTFDGTANTADRSYTLPDVSGTFGLLGSSQTWSGTNNFTSLGIGTSSPTAPLEVVGAIKFGNGINLQTALDNKADLGYTLNTQTASYTLTLADASSKVVDIDSITAINVTIPNNSSVAYPNGAVITLAQYNVGQVTIVGASGVTILSSGSRYKMSAQYALCTLIKRTTNQWYLSGDLTT